METTTKRRGRPRGSKDSKPRYRSPYRVPREVLETPALTVEQRVTLLKRPERISVFSKICGFSTGLLRNKIKRGEIKAFHSRGLLLIEPADFLTYWKGARLPVTLPRKSPQWESRAIAHLARLALHNNADRETYERIATRARLLTFVPQDQWDEVVWLEEEL